MNKYIAEVVIACVVCITLVVIVFTLCSSAEHALAFKQGYQQVQQYGNRGYLWQKKEPVKNE